MNLEGNFRNLNFSHSTTKTTEYSFELSLSILYKYNMNGLYMKNPKLITPTSANIQIAPWKDFG